MIFEIFWTFFKISWMSFGGVFGTLPQLEEWIVVQNKWITHVEFVQAYVIGSVVPGPNMAMCPLIGYRMGGIAGFVVAFIGIYSAPAILMGGAYAVYSRYRKLERVRRAELALRPLVFGLLTAAAARFLVSIGNSNGAKLSLLSIVMAVALSVFLFLGYYKKKLGPLQVMFLAGFVWWSLSYIPFRAS